MAQPSRTPHGALATEEVTRLVSELVAEVSNGGFDQFFFNSTGDEVATMIEALDAIGARKTASIVRRACAKFPGGMPPADRFARQDALEVVSPETDAFEDEDADIYLFEEDLEALVAAYVPD